MVSLTLADGTEVGLPPADRCRRGPIPAGTQAGPAMASGDVLASRSRGYLSTAYSDDPWLTSHLETALPDAAPCCRYGWIFPLGRQREVNIGVGALSTSRRPADLALRPLISYYTDLRRDEWGFTGQPRAVIVGAVADGRRGFWSGRVQLDGSSAATPPACVNPLNGGHRLRAGNRAAGQ